MANPQHPYQFTLSVEVLSYLSFAVIGGGNLKVLSIKIFCYSKVLRISVKSVNIGLRCLYLSDKRYFLQAWYGSSSRYSITYNLIFFIVFGDESSSI